MRKKITQSVYISSLVFPSLVGGPPICWYFLRKGEEDEVICEQPQHCEIPRPKRAKRAVLFWSVIYYCGFWERCCISWHLMRIDLSALCKAAQYKFLHIVKMLFNGIDSAAFATPRIAGWLNFSFTPNYGSYLWSNAVFPKLVFLTIRMFLKKSCVHQAC